MPEECTALLRRMRRELKAKPSLECYGYVVSALQAAGRSREAVRWLRRVVQPEVSHSLVQRAVADGELVTREKYNKVLSSYAAAGRPAEAVAAMKQMVSTGGVTPDIVSFNCLIAAHAAAGDPDKACAWLERAAHWGLSADVVTYTTVISGYARCARPQSCPLAYVRFVSARPCARSADGSRSTSSTPSASAASRRASAAPSARAAML